MLQQYPTTIPAEIRDFPEWHHGRKTYAVWILRAEGNFIQAKFAAAKKHLSNYLLEPYSRQPHITLFVCGFLVDAVHYDDDFTHKQLQDQIQVIEESHSLPFEIEVGGLNSFASAPFLEVSDPQGNIARLRDTLSRGAREFRTAPYRPHLTVGLYAGAFPSKEVTACLAAFPQNPTKCKVEKITLATYEAQEIAGLLTFEHELLLNGSEGNGTRDDLSKRP